MGIKTYSLSKDGAKNLSPNFQVREFACPGSDAILIDNGLVTILQNIRDHFKVPVTINSAYRTVTYNAKVRGASNSLHLKGMAADIGVKGISPSEVAKFVESIGVLGIGCYEGSSYGTFNHVDTRTSKYFWKNENNNSVETFGGAPVQAVTVGYSQEEFNREVQEAIGAGIDGKAYANGETIKKTPTLSRRKNRYHKAVVPVQKKLKELGYYTGKIDQDFGPLMEQAVNAFEKDVLGVRPDGEITAGKSMWKKLLGII